ncbi:MAG: PAS domain S-box protein, partial [Candidatus Heimdallarchaeota archaeon]|nr:PAS domain S-box protein [Candidatus Heimdallarchaeota archaeon]
KIIDINESVCKLLGYSKDEIVGTVSGERVVSTQRNSYRRELENLINNKNFSGEYDIRKKDGSVLTIEARGAAFGDYAFAIGRDITERKQMEKALLEIEEREQQRIGYELHDGLGQMIAGISLKCQNLESKLKEKSIPEAEDISRITFLLEKTKEQLRLLLKGMLPVEMNTEGLSAALEELAWNTKEIFDVPCVFRCAMPVQLCNRIKNINLFRIAQEAVANAVKHGRPERIEISLSRGDDEFKLTITDDGAGIPEISKETNGLGLKIMNYRAEMIGASLDIRSEIDRGTSIICIFYDTIDEK